MWLLELILQAEHKHQLKVRKAITPFGGFRKWWVYRFTQQPWIFLVKLIILGNTHLVPVITPVAPCIFDNFREFITPSITIRFWAHFAWIFWKKSVFLGCARGPTRQFGRIWWRNIVDFSTSGGLRFYQTWWSGMGKFSMRLVCVFFWEWWFCLQGEVFGLLYSKTRSELSVFFGRAHDFLGRV